MRPLVLAAIATGILSSTSGAQATGSHPAGHHDMSAQTGPKHGGQYAFATISEIVRILKADPSTDWSKVNLETLRQHLIDMDDALMRSSVAQKSVPGGMQLDITGTGRTISAIRRMVTSHAHVLEEHTPYKPTVRTIPNGVRLTVVASDTSSAAAVAMLRGLGFAGILVEGEHHAEHHLMMARGSGHH